MQLQMVATSSLKLELAALALQRAKCRPLETASFVSACLYHFSVALQLRPYHKSQACLREIVLDLGSNLWLHGKQPSCQQMRYEESLRAPKVREGQSGLQAYIQSRGAIRLNSQTCVVPESVSTRRFVKSLSFLPTLDLKYIQILTEIA